MFKVWWDTGTVKRPDGEFFVCNAAIDLKSSAILQVEFDSPGLRERIESEVRERLYRELYGDIEDKVFKIKNHLLFGRTEWASEAASSLIKDIQCLKYQK